MKARNSEEAQPCVLSEPPHVGEFLEAVREKLLYLKKFPPVDFSYNPDT